METLKSVDILLPNVEDLSKWAVVSCDQFTSQPEYWEELKNYVGDAPSALNLIYPEVYLGEIDGDKRIENINATMQEYLDKGVFKTIKDSFILVKRTTNLGYSRLGLMVAIDLEEYSYEYPTNASIRSTEGVVLDRIPPRLKIRTNAPLELPHIMLLIDDRKKSVIEPLYENRASLEKLYDFDLNMDGGHLEGYRVDSKKVLDIFDNYKLTLKDMYGEDTTFLFAVGDGNHSLATAKAHWENVKKTLKPCERKSHPARYCLCEVENLHDDGILFEPIHRFVFGADLDAFISFAKENLSGESKVKFFNDSKSEDINVDKNSAKAIKDIQTMIDKYIEKNKLTVDYIHGKENLESVANKNKGVAILMPKINKTDLFSYVMKNGTLCRKAFSMGEAQEKRYYLEAKKITK